MKILIVDDNDTDVRVLRTMLLLNKQFNIDVEYTFDGKEVLNIIFDSYKNKAPFDLVFLDIMMPDIDGFNVLKEVKKFFKNKRLKLKTKFVFQSASSNLENIKKAFKEDVEDFLIKPIKEDEVIEIIKKVDKI